MTGKQIYYAIGDIHGEFDKLIKLHEKINLHHKENFSDSTLIIIHLGDYVDRGKQSYEVVDCLMKMESDRHLNVINLKGNHEQMMIDAYKGNDHYAPDVWKKYGGSETLRSYRRNNHQSPPASHLKWMDSLPSFYWDKEAKLIFVHAGIDPVHFPNDGEDTHLWTRSKLFFNVDCWDNSVLDKVTVVHGHTPTSTGNPEVCNHFSRINIDTGACYGGSLTAVAIGGNTAPDFIKV